MKKSKLTKEEQAVLDSFERGEWKPAAKRREAIARHVTYARNTLAKDRRVNIRISSKDLEQLQTIAAEDGMPYQTLMASVLHRFAAKRFVDTASRTGKAWSLQMIMAGECTCMVTGDRDRLALPSVQGIRVVAPSDTWAMAN